jgi:DNA-binding CsgD family transcriptional regulator
MNSDASQFSEREKEVAGLLMQGKSNKQIALALGISESTIEYHLNNIYKKLQISSRTEAVLRLGKSIVEINSKYAENGGKSISTQRFPMNKKFYFVGGGLLATAAVVIIILANVSTHNADIVPTVQAGITPTYKAMPTATLNVTGTPEANLNVTGMPEVNPISITKVIDTGDSYILMGEFIPPPGSVLSDSCCNIELFDGNGKVIVGEMPMDIDPGTPTANTPFAFTWVRKFEKGVVAMPVTVKAEDLHWRSVSVSFEFDAGDNPQMGDKWQINQPFEVSGRTITLATIRVISPQIPKSGGGYAFSFTYPPDNNNIALDDISIKGYPPPINAGFSGGGSSGEPTPTQNGIDFSVEFTSLPKGKLTVDFTFKVENGGQQWTLPWQP